MVVETETYKGHLIEIIHDEDPMDPRTDWDPLTEFHVKNSRHYLGENQHETSEEIDDVVEQAEKAGDMVFELFAYIHGGTALSLGSFHDKALPQGHAHFDSGQCGVVIVRRKVILENFGKKKWTKRLRQKAYEIAESDVKTFTQYLNGEIYGFDIDDHEESCGGYYSVEDAMAEAKDIVDYMVKQAKKSHFEQLKIWIKNRVPFGKRQSMLAAIRI